MVADPETQAALTSLRDKMADHDGTVRVLKHELANMQQAQIGLGLQIGKLDDKFVRVEEKLGAKLDALADRLSVMNIKQEKGAGFIAGVAAVLTICVTIVLFIAKLLFGGNP